MSGCFLPKYLDFLLLEAQKRAKNPPKSDIQCQGQIDLFKVCCPRRRQKTSRTTRQKMASSFFPKYQCFLSFRSQKQAKKAQNSQSHCVVKAKKSLYAVPVPKGSGIQVKQQSHLITEDFEVVGDDLQKIFDRSIHTLPPRDAAL